MKIEFTKKEFKYLQNVGSFTDLIPSVAPIENDKVTIEMSLDDWDEVNGFVAAVCNHSESPTEEKVLDEVFFRIQDRIQQT